MSFAAAPRLCCVPTDWSPAMTVIARSPRLLPTGHAYTVPVVREIEPPRSAPASGVW
jgi:hypothetical protein